MQIILDKFGSNGTDELVAAHCMFQKIIARLEEIYNLRPFNQQTAQSLTELYALVKAVRPTTIFELGAGTRSSTLALAIAAAQLDQSCSIVSVDIAPVDFPTFVHQHFSDLALAPVKDVAMDATKFEIPPEWEGQVLMLYDAHDDDLPGVKIFPHAHEKWFPQLPGAIVAVHDCSVFSQPQSALASYYSQAAYSPEINIVGFGEVPALVEYLKRQNLTLGLPGRELEKLGIRGEGTSLIYFRLPGQPKPIRVQEKKNWFQRMFSPG